MREMELSFLIYPLMDLYQHHLHHFLYQVHVVESCSGMVDCFHFHHLLHEQLMN
tara:strand:+ start:508 stop:669 length:162 start_codon:yes stop_codon:yes gene_type:complete